MRRYLTAGLISALTLAAGTAQAQFTSIDYPTQGNDEFGTTNTLVGFTLPTGLDGAAIVDGEALLAFVDLIDDDGNVIFMNIAAPVTGGAGAVYVDAAGGSFEASLSNVGVGNLANPAVTGMRLKLRTAGGDGSFVSATRNTGDEAADQVLTVVRADEAPMLVSSFITDDDTFLFLEFNKSLNDGTGVNDANQSLIADIDGDDFNEATSNDFSTPASLGSVVDSDFFGSDNTFIRLELGGGATVGAGDFVRPAFDAMGDSENDLFDLVGLNATSDAVQVQAQTDLTIERIEVLVEIQSVVPRGTDVGYANAVEVFFNLPVAGGDLGSPAFYGGALKLPDGTDSEIEILNVFPGSMSNSVLLDVGHDFGNSDIVRANGTNADGTFYDIITDPDEDVPSSIFDSDDYQENSQTVQVEDGIHPFSIADAFTKDSDGDGTLDGVMLVFSETLDSALDGGDAGDMGITITRLDNTIRPFGLVDPVTGERGSIELEANDDDEDDEIDVTSITLASFDVDDDGTISELEMNNALCISYDPAQDLGDTGGGWDNDTETSADAPGTGDTDNVLVSVDADNSTIADANGVSIDEDTDNEGGSSFDTGDANDGAAPVAVNSSYRTGDNFAFGLDTFGETDGVVGDGTQNNHFYAIFSEDLGLSGDARSGSAFPQFISWGAGTLDRFASADDVSFRGPDNNILTIRDGEGRGFAPGDTVTFSAGNGISEGSRDNEIIGSFPAPDGTPPFVALQTDINGDQTISAFLFDTDVPADGFADVVRLFTNVPADPDTVRVGDFSYNGGNDFMGEAMVDGQQITLTFPDDLGSEIPMSSEVTVIYDAPANNDEDDSKVIAGFDGNSVFPGTMSTFAVEAFPTPDVDTDDLAVMDLSGTIEMGGSPIGVGAKVFATVGVPVPKMLTFTSSNITHWVSDESSLEAFWDFMFGFEDHLYAIDNNGHFWFTNSVPGEDSDKEVFDIAVNAGNLTNVTFTGRGRSYTDGDSTPERNLNMTSGRVTMGWDVLRSSHGTTQSLKSSGYDFSGDAIASRAVIDSSTGDYEMHVSAPISQFYSTFGTSGWPVIVIVEASTGNRYPASSIHNAIDNQGPLLFRSLQRNTLPNTDNGRSNGSNVVFDINLDNLGLEMAYNGWNLLPFNRVSGFARAAGNIPTLPAIQGSDNSNVRVGNTLPFTRPFNQFVYFLDRENDGIWTAADDDNMIIDLERGAPGENFLSSMIVDVDCIDHMRFVMTNRGVNVGGGVNAFIGGYAAGFYQNSGFNLGVFQFGAAPSETTRIFNGTFSSGTTLGWALVTAPADGTDPDAWLDLNDADFVIEFNRISGSEVDVNTHGLTGEDIDNINDVEGINEGQAYFVSFE